MVRAHLTPLSPEALIYKGFRVFHCDENRSVFRGKNAFLPISPTFFPTAKSAMPWFHWVWRLFFPLLFPLLQWTKADVKGKFRGIGGSNTLDILEVIFRFQYMLFYRTANMHFYIFSISIWINNTNVRLFYTLIFVQRISVKFPAICTMSTSVKVSFL